MNVYINMKIFCKRDFCCCCSIKQFKVYVYFKWKTGSLYTDAMAH